MSKRLVAYFSASGVTAKVAENLADAIGADVFEIQPEVPYTKADLNWMDKKSRSTIEMSDPTSRPAIAAKRDNMDEYDTIFAFGVHLAADFHREVIFVLRQKRFCRFHIRFQCFDLTLCRSNFSWIAARNIRFQAINLTGVIGFQQFQFADLNIQIHLFLDVGITRCQCLDFGIGQRGIVHIITGTDRRFSKVLTDRGR